MTRLNEHLVDWMYALLAHQRLRLEHMFNKYCQCLIDVVEFVLHRGQLIGNSAHSHGTIPRDPLLSDQFSEDCVDLDHSPKSIVFDKQVRQLRIFVGSYQRQRIVVDILDLRRVKPTRHLIEEIVHVSKALIR